VYSQRGPGKNGGWRGIFSGLNAALSVAGHFTSLHRTTDEFGGILRKVQCC